MKVTPETSTDTTTLVTTTYEATTDTVTSETTTDTTMLFTTTNEATTTNTHSM
jgi:hypothetical protein